MKSGIYRMNFRGLTFREIFRFGGIFGFPLAIVLKLIGKKGAYQWLPHYEAEQPCDLDLLSGGAQSVINANLSAVQVLGYDRFMFSRMVINVNPDMKDSGACLAMHCDGCKFIHMGYVHYQTKNYQRETVALSGGFIDSTGRWICVLNHKDFLDDGGRSFKIVLKDATARQIDDRLGALLRDADQPSHAFSSIDELRLSVQDVENDAWEERIQRRLFFKVSHEEQDLIMRRYGDQS